jgi:hypothetical protein
VQALRDETAPDPHDSAEEEEEEVEDNEGKWLNRVQKFV